MVAMDQIETLTRKIAAEFDPQRVILFGSYAYGAPREFSDVDLLVIMPFAGSSFRKSLEIIRRIRPSFYVDVVVRDPDDAERRYREGDPLIREAFDRGEVLYEQNG